MHWDGFTKAVGVCGMCGSGKEVRLWRVVEASRAHLCRVYNLLGLTARVRKVSG